jgi:hypothetical protein
VAAARTTPAAIAPPRNPWRLKLAEGEGPRVIAEFADYDGMLAVVRARIAELQINGERFDEFAGLPKGYLSKLTTARPVRKIAKSMGPLFAGLGLRLLVIEDADATERLKNGLLPRNQAYVRSVAVHGHLTTRFLKKIGRKGGENSRMNLSKRLRKQLARKAALARWGKGAT